MSSSPTVSHSSGQIRSFRQSLLAMIGISFVTLLVAFDQTVIGTALPTIVAELKDFNLYAWVATSYLLTSIITVPIFGRLGDYYGRKPFLIGAIVIFTTASVLCGEANNMISLVLARSLQGIGGGMLVGTAFAAIPDLFPDPLVRLRWQVMLSSAFGIANAIGPSLGGFLTQSYGWRSVFYVNLPIGLLSLFFVWRYLPHLRNIKLSGKMRLDWVGAGLIALVLGCLQFFVELLPAHGLTLRTTALFVLSVIAAYALWKWERRAQQPILPIEMFRNRGLSALFVLAVLSGFALFSLLFYTPLLLQGGFGLSPKEAGLVITPLVVCITIGSILNGRIITFIRNPNMMLHAGFILLALACLGIASATRAMSHALLLTFMVSGGIGLGFILPNLTVFAQQCAEREHLGIATALLQSLRMIGGMIGATFTGTLVSHIYAKGVQDALAPNHAMSWLAQMSDPQILINHAAQSTLIGQLSAAGHNGLALLEAAREALVSAIHIGIAVVAVVAVASLWQVWRTPRVTIKSHAAPSID